MRIRTASLQRTVILVVLATLFGCVATWGLSSLQNGTQADWVAAGGTWVIGVAACTLTFLQARSNDVAKNSGEIRQLRTMSVRVKSLKLIAKRLISVDQESPKASTPRIIISAMQARCSAMNLDISVVDTDEKLEEAYLSFDYQVMATESLCGSLLGADLGKSEKGKMSDIVEYKWVRDQAFSLCAAADALELEIRRKITSVSLLH